MKLSNEFKAGVIVVLGIFIAIAGIFYLKGVNIFNPAISYYAIYDNVAGISVGTQVTINGHVVGQVREKNLLQDGRTKLMFHIENDHVIITQGTEAQIYNTSLLGGKAIQLNIKAGLPELPPHSELVAVNAEEMVDMLKTYINPLESKANSLVGKLDTLVVDISAQFNAVADNANKTISSIRYLVNGKMGKVMDGITTLEGKLNEQTIPEVNKMLKEFNKLAANLNKGDLDTIMGSLKGASRNIEELLVQAKSDSSTLGKLLHNGQMHDELVETNNDIQSLLKDIEEHPDRYVHVSVFGKIDPQTKYQNKLDKKAYKEAYKKAKRGDSTALLKLETP